MLSVIQASRARKCPGAGADKRLPNLSVPSDQVFFRVLVQTKDSLINQSHEAKYFLGEPGAEVPGC